MAVPSALPHPAAPGVVGPCLPAAAEPLLAADVAADLAAAFKALADPTRVRLLAHVAAAPDGTVCACHLPARLGISQPTLSHHLKRLTEAGLVTREQRGRWAHYTAVPAALAPLRAFLSPSSAGPAAPGGAPEATPGG